MHHVRLSRSMSTPAAEKTAPPSGFELPSHADPVPPKGLSSLGATQARLSPVPGSLISKALRLCVLGASISTFSSIVRVRENAFVGRDHAPSVILVHDSGDDALNDLAAKLKDFSGDIASLAVTWPLPVRAARILLQTCRPPPMNPG